MVARSTASKTHMDKNITSQDKMVKIRAKAWAFFFFANIFFASIFQSFIMIISKLLKQGLCKYNMKSHTNSNVT